MTLLLRHVRHNSLALLALFVALGGTSYAAVALPRNSVGANQIRTAAVASSEVKDRSLTSRDFKSGQLPAGARGAAGPVGPAGAPGAQGAQGPAGPTESLAVRLRRGSGSTQTIPSTPTATAMEAVAFGAEFEQYDVGGLYDPATNPDAIRIPRDGTYVVTAGVRWASNATGVRSLALNGPQPGGVRAQSTVPANPAATTAQNVATTERFAAGDLVTASVGQSSGGDLALAGSQNQVHLSATYVGP